jgi:hypothetical protein
MNGFLAQFADVAESRSAASIPDAHSTRLALELNPISVVSLYRAGATFEVTISEKLALNFTPSYMLALNGGVFGEVGLRRYSSHLSGPFIGLSLLAGSFSHRCQELSSPRQGSLYGLAADVGYQWLTPRGFVISLGAGAQVQRSVTECAVDGSELEQPIVVPSVSRSGVLPRLQFAIGYSWSP